VGHSLFLNTRSRLRRVYVADPNILNSVTLSPNQIVVTAMTSGISSLILLDEAGQTQSYVVSSDLDVAGLRTAMSEAMHGDIVNIEGNGDRVILSGKVEQRRASRYGGKAGRALLQRCGECADGRARPSETSEAEGADAGSGPQQGQQYGINLFNPGGNTSFLAATTTSQYPSTATYTRMAHPAAC
jgi:pilus assembly protein CpaC